MNCPNCDVHVDEHEAGPCFDLWILEDVLKWERSERPYTGDFYPEGSYFIIWTPQDDHPCITGVSQAFDKDGNNLRANKDNPLGVWDESPEYNYSLQFSTDISAAWEVLEVVGENNLIRLSGYLYDGRENYWTFAIRGHYDVKAPTVELAICRAAIKANHNAR